MPTSKIAERVQTRMDALRLNSAEASRRAGLGRTSVHDLISGRKQTMEGHALISLARALETTPEFLLGEDEVVARTHKGEIPVVGIVELGAWRAADDAPASRFVAVHESMSDDVAYLVRGDGAMGVGIHDSSIVIVARGGEFRHGDIVVCQQQRDDLIETSIRQVHVGDRKPMFVAPTLGKSVPPLGQLEANVIGVVVRAVLLFHSQVS